MVCFLCGDHLAIFAVILFPSSCTSRGLQAVFLGAGLLFPSGVYAHMIYQDVDMNTMSITKECNI
jgi:hypothetical protein